MARAVERAYRASAGYLVAEAGTGTGKTLAYLVPGGALRAPRDRLHRDEDPAGADLVEGHPAAQGAVGLEFAAAYLKGRSNYFCLARGNEFARARRSRPRGGGALAAHRGVGAHDRDRRPRRDRPPRPVPHLEGPVGDAETCAGRECEQYEDCFVTRARARAGEADVLLVNHHLFFADLAMRTSRAGVEILPEPDVVVFDEAHAIEEVATEYFGVQVSSYRVDELAATRCASSATGPTSPR